jgi:hypothetical protein
MQQQHAKNMQYAADFFREATSDRYSQATDRALERYLVGMRDMITEGEKCLAAARADGSPEADGLAEDVEGLRETYRNLRATQREYRKERRKK